MPVKRERLTRERIVEKALELIEQDGLENLSTRALGKALGVQAMALYHHVPSKDALLDAVASRLIATLEIPEAGTDWRADLETLAKNYMSIVRRFPRAFVLLAARRFNTQETLPALDRIFAIFRSAGLPPQEVAAAFRLMGYFMNGAGLAEVATRDAASRTDFQLTDPDFLAGYPGVRATIPFLALPYLDGIFEKGLKVILDSIENDPRRITGALRAAE